MRQVLSFASGSQSKVSSPYMWAHLLGRNQWIPCSPTILRKDMNEVYSTFQMASDDCKEINLQMFVSASFAKTDERRVTINVLHFPKFASKISTPPELISLEAAKIASMECIFGTELEPFYDEDVGYHNTWCCQDEKQFRGVNILKGDLIGIVVMHPNTEFLNLHVKANVILS